MVDINKYQGSLGRRLLVVAPWIPEFDRHAGALRFFCMLRILSREYRVILLGRVRDDGARYVAALESIGVQVHDAASTTMEALLPHAEVAVFFEFYHAAETLLDVVRVVRSDLPIVVDSVDLHFVRESRGAAYAQAPQTAYGQALETRRRELCVYRRADAVIVVTESDKRALLDCLPDVRVTVVPTIHEV